MKKLTLLRCENECCATFSFDCVDCGTSNYKHTSIRTSHRLVSMGIRTLDIHMACIQVFTDAPKPQCLQQQKEAWHKLERLMVLLYEVMPDFDKQVQSLIFTSGDSEDPVTNRVRVADQLIDSIVTLNSRKTFWPEANTRLSQLEAILRKANQEHSATPATSTKKV